MTRHVLLIDDDPDIRLVTGTALNQVAGWQVTEAASGPEGVDLARRERPDAVLLDVMMPGVDGPATLARFKADETLREIPVVMLTTNAQLLDPERLGELGAAGILNKPFDPFTLHERLADLLGWDHA